MARLVKWSCPFCQHVAMLDSEGDMVENVATLRHRSSTGSYILVTTYQVCPNPGCRRFTLQAQLFESRFRYLSRSLGDRSAM